VRRLRDRELATTEPVRSGDKGAGVVAGVRARKDRDPALYLRILARGIDRLRIVFTPRAQDDQIVAEFQAANANSSPRRTETAAQRSTPRWPFRVR